MEPHLLVVLTAVVLPFAGAVLVSALYRLLGEAVGYVGALVAAGSFALLLSQVGQTGTVSVPWIPSMEVALRFRVDGLGLLFALLASGIGVLIFVYSVGYMHGEPNLGRFYAALSAFLGSILGVALAADLVALFLFWELTSVCSFVLIGYHTEDPESQYSARMAMLVTVGGGLCLLVGVLLLAVAADAAGIGTFNLAAMLGEAAAVEAELRERGLFVPALLFVTVAAAAKSAQVPLYFWLPRAMVAPTPVSAFLHSATMVKVGVYALARLRPLFQGVEWLVVVATLGLLTMVVGAMLAVRARDIKELLAYSTVSHLGLMVAGFGFQTHYGPEAGAFHLLNHALFKAALFLVAGIIAHEVGTRDVDEIGGLWRDLPVTAGISAVTALSMAGLPPFNGFYSKEILFEAAWETAQAHGGPAWLFPVTAVFGSVFTVLYSLRFLWLFLGDRPDALGSVPRPSPGLVAPPAVLAVGVVVVGLVPDLATGALVDDAASASAAESVTIDAKIPTSLSGPVGMSIVTIVAGVALFPSYERVRGGLDTVHQVTVHAHPPRLYNDLLSGTETASDALTGFVHNGLIRTYVWWTLGAACALVLGGFAATAVGLPAPVALETPVTMALVLAVAVLAAVAVTTAESHVTAVLTLGILGFMVAVFYILASGPDLALTQLVVETLLLLIFLLALEEMPAFYGDLDWGVATRDAALSVVVGATAFVSVLLARPSAEGDLSKTAGYYVDNAVKEGGGGNVVNVILTDFRAFDTLGESIVIVLAAVSVLVLITMRNRGEQQ